MTEFVCVCIYVCAFVILENILKNFLENVESIISCICELGYGSLQERNQTV